MSLQTILIIFAAIFCLSESRAEEGDKITPSLEKPAPDSDSLEFSLPKRTDSNQKKAAYEAKLERFHAICTPEHFTSFSSVDSSAELTEGEKKKCKVHLNFLNPTME